jgi:hypothetical protein
MGSERQKIGVVPMLSRICHLVLPAVFAAGSVSAAPPSLSWPVECHLGEDCWIVHHPDADPGPAASDYRCGSLTYNGHKGTDIALPDRAAIFYPTPVLAAAAGIVLGARDTMPDHLGDPDSIRAVSDAGKECGNGVGLDHGGGWVTQYCHMKSGSVRVAKGERVEVGQLLGYVGESGAAEFPHLHISVRFQDQDIDPFTGLPLGAGCSAQAKGTLWSSSVVQMLPPADAPILTAVGFRQASPLFDALKEDTSTPDRLSADAPALILWAMAYGLRKGDKMEFRITDQDGKTVHAQTFEQAKDQIRRMQFTGRRNSGWLEPGRYIGTVRIERQAADGTSITQQREARVLISPP